MLGVKSYTAINQSGQPLLDELRTAQADFYKLLALQKHALKVFLKGWLRRASS